MDDVRADLERSLAQDQAALSAALTRLRGACHGRIPLRRRIRARPHAWMIGALAAGLLLSLRPSITRRLLALGST